MDGTLIGKVKLVSPAKIGGRRRPAGATVEVSARTALRLAEMGAIDATPAQVAEMRAALAAHDEAGAHATDAVAPIVALMTGDTAETLKTEAGNWSAAKIGAALGRKVSGGEIETAAKAAELTAAP